MAGKPDPKRGQRIRDRALLSSFHLRVRRCALADDTCESTLSIHHIHKHPRDDVTGNLVMLCGSGTTGHHGKIENHDAQTCGRLYVHIRTARPDTMEYLAEKLGGEEARDEWLKRLL